MTLKPPAILSVLSPQQTPCISVVMGSQSDWNTLIHCHLLLREFEIPHECRIVSAHRTPELLPKLAHFAESQSMRAIIAGAGGAAHLPGMIAAHTYIPVIGVPMPSVLQGVDSLLSIVQMPKGVPVATMSIGESGAINAALLAIAILATQDHVLKHKLQTYRDAQKQKIDAPLLV